ncbi:DUF3793 family protein [Lachnospiraceae bacterium ZAX-1]
MKSSAIPVDENKNEAFCIGSGAVPILDIQIAVQCAPVLLGIKMSNILITMPEHENFVYHLFKNTVFSVVCIQKDRQRIAFLIYHRRMLEQYMQCREVAIFMKKQGYQNLDLDGKIKELSKRFSAHIEKKSEFPHEMGMFLGYPFEDVVGFMEQKGKNYLYAGYWKVYGNINTAKRSFASYNRAKRWVCAMVSQGVPVMKIIHSYSMHCVAGSTKSLR